MNEKKLKIIILTHGGAERLLELLSEIKTVEIVGVFVETATEKQRKFKEKIKRSIRYDGYFATFKKLFKKENQDVKAIQTSQDDLENCAAKLKIPLHKIENYHAESAIKLLKEQNAELGILYGTNIIKEAVFSIPRLGSINIHQGLAPIYRGGPTVFWELFNDEKSVGITVHFVAPKVVVFLRFSSARLRESAFSVKRVNSFEGTSDKTMSRKELAISKPDSSVPFNCAAK